MFYAILKREYATAAGLYKTLEELATIAAKYDYAIAQITALKIEGETYRDRRNAVRRIAAETLGGYDIAELSYQEENTIREWIEDAADRYGLTAEFMREGLI